MTEIVWDESETPIAARFDDPYYSKRDGRAETRHVFIEGNRLAHRFAGAERFHIAELGFGTGLNFLETLHCWHRNASPAATLVYTSFELFPLSKDETMRALRPWPELIATAEAYLDLLTFKEGWQDIALGRTVLRLGIGDANVLIDSMSEKADAWYLDGFSPAKNPELWNPALMQAVGRNTKADGTFATYTAAGWVRRMLADAGFEVGRIGGFGTKRHMSVGVMPSSQRGGIASGL